MKKDNWYKNRTKWVKKQIDLGWTYEEIGKKLCLSRQAVWSMVNRRPTGKPMGNKTGRPCLPDEQLSKRTLYFRNYARKTRNYKYI